MLSIEVRLRVDGREVSLDRFADEFAVKIAKEIGSEVERRLGGMRFPDASRMSDDPQVKKPEPKAVGLEEAGKMLGVSPATVRLYVRRGKIHAVRFGRRVLVPMESIRKVLREGVSKSTS